MLFDKKMWAAICFATLTSACGNFSLNEMLVSKEQEESIDQLVQEAQYEYDKGRYDNALSLTEKAHKISPSSEAPLILQSYVYLSKGGLDGINISKQLIVSNENKTASADKSGDTTTDSFNTLKKVLKLTDTDFNAMGTAGSIGTPALPIYFPRSATAARGGAAPSPSLGYFNKAIATLCPMIASNANPTIDNDARHTCVKNTNGSEARGRSNFAWALAHLGEAISFYTVILYDTNGDGKPNIQEALPTETLTTANASTYITTLNTLNTAINAIFPTDPALAADSMLNALFGDLETASTALSAIPGIPSEVTESVKKSIDDLNTKIAAITVTTGNANSAQNEALKNSLTTGIASTLESKIESPQFSQLNTTQQSQACCVYRNMNAKAAMPTTCSAATYNDTACAALLAQ